MIGAECHDSNINLNVLIDLKDIMVIIFYGDNISYYI